MHSADEISETENDTFFYTCKCKEYSPVYKSTDDKPPRDPHVTLHKLCNLLENKISQDLLQRHLILIDQAVKANKYGFFLHDLRYVSCVMERVGDRLDENPAYKLPFMKFLSVCALPPLMHHNCDKTTQMIYFEEYISMLGFLLVWLTDESVREHICNIIIDLLTPKPPLTKNTVCHEWINEAVEGSHLPEIIVQLAESSSHDIYRKIVDICLIASKISLKACHKMLYVGALDVLMLHFDSESNLRKPSVNLPISDMLDMWDTIRFVINKSVDALWEMLCSLDEADEEFISCLQAPCSSALWCLRTAIRIDFIKQYDYKRNQKLAVALKILQHFPDADFVGSGFAEAIIVASTATEMTPVRKSWVYCAKFVYDENYILFKKTLLLCLCTLVHNPSARKLMRDHITVLGLIKLVSLQSTKFCPEDRLSFAKYALHLLRIVGIELMDQIIKYDGIMNMLIIIDGYLTKNTVVADDSLVETCLKTFHKLATIENEDFMENVKNNFGVSLFTHFCKNLISKSKLTFFQGKLLTYCFSILKHLRGDQGDTESILQLTINYMKRILNPTQSDSQTNVETVICAIDLVWAVVNMKKQHLKYFVMNGGVYCLLDVLVSMPFVVRLIGLGCLVDMCEHSTVIPFVITWRGGSDKTINIYSLVARIFDEENRKVGTQMTNMKIIKDATAPLMGENQYRLTYEVRKPLVGEDQVNLKYETGTILSSSPTILEMFGSVRPKIYALLQLFHRHEKIVASVKTQHQITSTPLTHIEKIVMVAAENYLTLKIAEAWNELNTDISVCKIKPIVVDREMLRILVRYNKKLVECIRRQQESILKKQTDVEIQNENRVYNLLRESKLQDAVCALQDLSNIARCSDRMFMLKHKGKQRKEIRRCASLPFSMTYNCFKHQTFFEKIATTAVFKQQLILPYETMHNPYMCVDICTDRALYKPLDK